MSIIKNPPIFYQKPLSKDDFLPAKGFKDLTAEKLVDFNNLQSIAWLSRGISLSAAICRILTRKGPGSGFLIGPDYIITNHHVLEDVEEARNAVAEFNYQKDWAGNLLPSERYNLRPSSQKGFKTDKDLDYSIVKVEGSPGNTFGYIDLDDRAKTFANDYVSIIQHPDGGVKQIALTDNKVSSVFDNFVQYTTDTRPGSSGSAVFNQKWQIVALHHKGGNLPHPTRGHVFINQGVNINSIVQHAALFLDLRTELFGSFLGDLNLSLTRFIIEPPMPKDLVAFGSDFGWKHPQFAHSLPKEIDLFIRPDHQITGEMALLGAVAIGFAAGAIVRLAARKEGHGALPKIGDTAEYPEIEDRETVLDSLHGDLPITSLLKEEGYVNLVKKLVKEKEALKPILKDIVPPETDEFITKIIATKVGAFLAGAVAGARAIDGKL